MYALAPGGPAAERKGESRCPSRPSPSKPPRTTSGGSWSGRGSARTSRVFNSFEGYDRAFGAGLWADEATVSVMAKYASFNRDRDIDVAFEIKVNWSATRRTVAQAAAALVSYRDAVEFAARCECFFQELPRVVVPAKVEA
jgi:hypothetical protein